MIADRTRRLRAEASGDWIELAYRGVLYTLAATPLWGAGVIVVIAWHRARL
jgi:hypothetical protein